MRFTRFSGPRRGRSSSLVLVSTWWLAVSALGSAACAGKTVRQGVATADGGPEPLQQGPDDAGAGLADGTGTAPEDDAGASRPPDAQGDAGPDAEAGVDASVPPVPATVARMNDVSILFPLPASAAEQRLLLAPSATGSRGVLFPSALYASEPLVFAKGGAAPTTAIPYADLQVVAMRIDPCFASLAPDPHGAGCTAQLRLVFQPVTMLNDAGFADDDAVHVFYDLSRDEFFSLARALVALRIANAQGEELGSLAPHPIMVRQGLGGAMSQGVQSLILQYAGEQNLVRVALEILTANPDLGVWQMSVFDVPGAENPPIPLAIPSMTDADGGAVFTEGLLAPLFGASSAGSYFASFSPTTSADNITPLGSGDAGGLAVPDRQAVLNALVRVENPRDNSAETIDCLSCHMAASLESFVARPLFSFDDTASPLAYQPDGTVVTPADMSATPDTNSTNIHVFSYLDARPQISQRVVNETAAVVEYLNDATP